MVESNVRNKASIDRDSTVSNRRRIQQKICLGLFIPSMLVYVFCWAYFKKLSTIQEDMPQDLVWVAQTEAQAYRLEVVEKIAGLLMAGSAGIYIGLIVIDQRRNKTKHHPP